MDGHSVRRSGRDCAEERLLADRRCLPIRHEQRRRQPARGHRSSLEIDWLSPDTFYILSRRILTE